MSGFPLAPLQSGLLFDELRVGGRGGFNVLQLCISFVEAVDEARLAQAWKVVVDRYPALRAQFRWEGGKAPEQQVVQVVQQEVVVHDWIRRPEDERNRAFEELLYQDRTRGFELHLAPLCRLIVVRMGSERSTLVWSVHHLLVDDISVRIVAREALQLYDDLGKTNEAPVCTSTCNFQRYAEWCAQRSPEAGRAFFRDLLTGKGIAVLPCAAPTGSRSAGSAYRQLGRHAPQELVVALSKSEAALGASQEVLVNAAFALVLARFCNEADLVFATMRSCRGPEFERTVGLLANLLPVRIGLDYEMSIQDLVLRVAEVQARVGEHEHLPLFEVTRALGQREVLFETTLTFNPWDLDDVLGVDTSGGRSCVSIEQPTSPFNVLFYSGKQLSFKVQFDAGRLSPTSVERFADALIVALGEMTGDPTRKLSDVSVISPAATVNLLATGNETFAPFPSNTLIHELFEARASEQPNACAVEFEDRQLSYAELNYRANRLAEALVDAGARPETFVAVCTSRSPDLIIALLAVAKSGAAYVPLDPRYPIQRLEFMLRDCEAGLVITDTACRGLFGERERVTFINVGDCQTTTQTSTAPIEARAKSTDVCYAIYTSGSTGEPNGVLLTHRAVVNTLSWVNRQFDVGPKDRLLFVTSPCFDLSVYDIFGALGAGATIVVATDEHLSAPPMLAHLLWSRRITIWNSAPATLNAAVPSCNSASVSVLRLVLLSGDWIPVSLPDAVRERFPSAQVVSLGGATEAAIWSNWYPIGVVDRAWPSIPYGVPIQNCRYHILDSQLRPVPIGVAGDLYIGGVCLARGYLNRPELTSSRFIQDPFVQDANERLYRTGDRALYFENGEIQFLGRQDSQLKIRGFRVELGEVEAALTRIVGIRQSVVTTYTDGSGERALRAYVVFDSGIDLDARQVREQVSRHLPPFAVPSQIRVMDELPLSVNGKIDRKLLPDTGERAPNIEFEAPQSHEEQQLVTLWEEVLQTRPIGITDNFFHLGGHSLLAVTLNARMNALLDTNIPLERFVARPTIRELAASASLARAQHEHLEHLHAFNPDGSMPPLVLFPGIYGTLFPLRPLPEMLGANQPVYLAEAIGLQGKGVPAEATIERMAEIYEAELLKVCSSRTIVLGGYSLGALVAFELARRLRARRINVPLLVSIDGTAPGYPEFMSPLPRIAAHVREFLQGDKRQYIRDRMINAYGRYLRALGREYELSSEELWATPEMRERIKVVWKLNTEAHQSYRPRFTDPSDLLLFRAELPERWIGRRELNEVHGWGSFIAGRISVETLPGSHSTILSTGNLSRLVRAIRDRMEMIESEHAQRAERVSGSSFQPVS